MPHFFVSKIIRNNAHFLNEATIPKEKRNVILEVFSKENAGKEKKTTSTVSRCSIIQEVRKLDAFPGFVALFFDRRHLKSVVETFTRKPSCT